jgi:hypothetical protein
VAPIIARKESSAERIFPPITPSLYQSSASESKLTVAQSAAVKMLATAGEKLSLWQKYLGWGQDTSARLSHLLLTHRTAFQLEQAGQWRRADFFWQRLYAKLASTFQSDEDWQSLAASLAAQNPELEILADPLKLQASLIEELLIDTHAAFYNGQAESSAELTVNSRLWSHLDYILKILEISALSPQAKLDCVGVAAEARFSLLKKAGQRQQAIALCLLILKFAPEAIEWQERLTELAAFHFLDTDDAHRRTAGSAHSNETLQKGIEYIEYLRQTYSLNLKAYDVLSGLYSSVAVNLANAGHLSSALVAAQTALTFNPASDNAAQILSKLIEEMEQLKDLAQGMKTEVSTNPATRLNDAAISMLDEARLGFEPLERYKRSAEARRIEEAFEVAKAGVEKKRSDTLRQPGERSRGFNKLAGYVPSLASRTAAAKQLGEPFDYWLLSKKDLRLKLQTLAAVVLLSMTGAFALKDMRARRIREATYQHLLQASNEHDYKQVIEDAEAFLAHPMVAATDGRDGEVVNRYNEALVLWVARQSGATQADLATHLERYRQLTGN